MKINLYMLGNIFVTLSAKLGIRMKTRIEYELCVDDFARQEEKKEGKNNDMI